MSWAKGQNVTASSTSTRKREKAVSRGGAAGVETPFSLCFYIQEEKRNVSFRMEGNYWSRVEGTCCWEEFFGFIMSRHAISALRLPRSRHYERLVFKFFNLEPKRCAKDDVEDRGGFDTSAAIAKHE